MKTKIFLMACVAMLTLGTSQVQAQGLGGLLKKGKKALETVNKALGDETNNNTQSNTKTNSSGSTVALENGGTLTNPMPQIIDVQLVGVYGKSTSTNYGTVHLVFKVKMIENRNSISFGVNVNYPGLMIDQDGNTYKTFTFRKGRLSYSLQLTTVLKCYRMQFLAFFKCSICYFDNAFGNTYFFNPCACETIFSDNLNARRNFD